MVSGYSAQEIVGFYYHFDRYFSNFAHSMGRSRPVGRHNALSLLCDAYRRVARGLEVLEKVGLVGVQERPQCAVAADVRGPARHERDARLRAHRVRHVRLVKARPLLREGVEVGRL